jgi:hypothetical protein
MDKNLIKEILRNKLLMEYNNSKTFSDNLESTQKKHSNNLKFLNEGNNNCEEGIPKHIIDIFDEIKDAADGHFDNFGTYETAFAVGVEKLKSREDVITLNNYIKCKTEFSSLKTWIWYEFSEDHDWNVKTKRRMDSWLNGLGIKYNLCYNCKLSTEKGPEAWEKGSSEWKMADWFNRIRSFKPEYGPKKYPYPYKTPQPEAPNHPKVDIPYTGNIAVDKEMWKKRMRHNYEDGYPAEFFFEPEENYTIKFGSRQDMDQRVYGMRRHEIEEAIYNGDKIPPWGEFVENKVYVDMPVNWPDIDREIVDRQEEIEKDDKLRNFNKYPNYCGPEGKYSDKAINPPPKNPDGAEGDDALIRGHCAYPGPNGSIVHIMSSAEIWFEKTSVLPGKGGGCIPFKNVDIIMNKFKLPEEKRDIILENYNNEFPLGTVCGYKDVESENWIMSQYIFNPKTYQITFTGWGMEKTDQKGVKSKYKVTPPSWKDERTWRQKQVDAWEPFLQWAGLSVVLMAVLFRGGSGTWQVAAEILIELGIGSLLSYREWEKGESFDAALSAVFAIIPMFKTLKWFQGLDETSLRRISESLKGSGLNKLSTEIDWLRWQRRLSPEDRLTFSKVFDDPFTRKRFIQELKYVQMRPNAAKEAVSAISQVYGKKEYKHLFKDLKWTQQLWSKELAAYTGAFFVEVCLETIFGSELDPQVKQDLAGVFQNIPSEYEREMGLNLVNNYQIIQTNTDVKKTMHEVATDFKSSDLEKQKIEKMQNYNRIRDSIKAAQGTWTEIERKKEQEGSKAEIIKQGYILCTEFNIKYPDCMDKDIQKSTDYSDVGDQSSYYCKCLDEKK